jgi:hypothetical protein
MMVIIDKGGNPMESIQCPFCKEEVNAEAIRCKYCRSRLYPSRRDMVMAAVEQQLAVTVTPPIVRPSGDACEAWCYYRFGRNRGRLQQCLDDCKAAKAIALLVEQLHREFNETIFDIIWGGGDIDPLPLEKEIRERFSSRRIKEDTEQANS